MRDYSYSGFGSVRLWRVWGRPVQGGGWGGVGGVAAGVAAVRVPWARVAGGVVAAVTDPSATVAAMAAMGAMDTAAVMRTTTGVATEATLCRPCPGIIARVMRTQPTPRGLIITGSFTHPRTACDIARIIQ